MIKIQFSTISLSDAKAVEGFNLGPFICDKYNISSGMLRGWTKTEWIEVPIPKTKYGLLMQCEEA